MRIHAMTLCSVLLVLGCVTPAPMPVLTPDGQGVRLIMNDPPEKCKELGDLNGSPTQGSVEVAKINLRNKAAAMGATHVRMDNVNQETMTLGKHVTSGPLKVTGTAYKCP